MKKKSRYISGEGAELGGLLWFNFPLKMGTESSFQSNIEFTGLSSASKFAISLLSSLSSDIVVSRWRCHLELKFGFKDDRQVIVPV